MCGVRDSSDVRAPEVDDLMSKLSDRVTRQAGSRVLVGVDGPDAAGKTILADALAERLPGSVLRASIDGFHQPQEHRLRRGALSPEGYYHDSFDYGALSRLLLEPFRSGEREVVVRAFDVRCETEVPAEPALVEDCAVLVFDGVFLLRPELCALWHMSIYLHVAEDVTLARARQRDLDLFGSEADIELGYRERYLPGQALYRDEADPAAAADVVIDNTEPAAPVVLRGLSA
jgi:uridine kinase